MLKSTTDRYGAIAVTIHWFVAIAIILVLVSGFQAGNAMDSAVKGGFLRLHIPAAIIVLLLTLLRIVWWWLVDRKPLSRMRSPLLQERLARDVHLALYVLILSMIASGIGMIALSGAGPNIFAGSAATLPDFHNFPPCIPHGLGANLLLALFAAHAGAALYHHSSAATGYPGACGTNVEAALINGRQMVSLISSNDIAGPIRNRVCSLKIA